MPEMIDIDTTVGVHDTAVHPQPTDEAPVVSWPRGLVPLMRGVK